MSEATGRPQDQGRRHRRKGRPGSETLALLDRYQAAMRTELASLLDTLEGQPGLLDTAVRPPLAERAKSWDLAIRLARELGGQVDPPAPEDDTADAPAGPSRRKVDFG